MKGAARLLVDVGFLVSVALLLFDHLAGIRPILRVALVAACAAVPSVALLGAVLAKLVTRTEPIATALLGTVAATYVFHALGEPTNNGRSGILFAILAGMTAALPEPA